MAEAIGETTAGQTDLHTNLHQPKSPKLIQSQPSISLLDGARVSPPHFSIAPDPIPGIAGPLLNGIWTTPSKYSFAAADLSDPNDPSPDPVNISAPPPPLPKTPYIGGAVFLLLGLGALAGFIACDQAKSVSNDDKKTCASLLIPIGAIGIAGGITLIAIPWRKILF